MEFSFWNTEDRGRVALIEHDGTEHTAGALLDAGNQVAHQLAARGIGPGDVVAMCLHNEVAVYELYLAVMQMGVYLVPINWHCTAVRRRTSWRTARPRRCSARPSLQIW